MSRTTNSWSMAVVIALLYLFVACCHCQEVTTSDCRQSDSINVVYREQVSYIPDTVYVTIPLQATERTTMDSVSHLENDYAISDACILTGGYLYHTLKTKVQTKPVLTTQKVVTQDSIIYMDRWRTVTKNVKVEKQLSWLQKAQIYGCRVLVLLALLQLLLRYRKSVVHIVRKLLGR